MNSWLGIRLEFVGNLVVLFAAMFTVITEPTPSIAGLSLSNALMVTGWLRYVSDLLFFVTICVSFSAILLTLFCCSWLVRMNTEFEMAMNSVERVRQYIHIESEAPAVIESSRPPSGWPNQGVIRFEDMSTWFSSVLRLLLL